MSHVDHVVQEDALRATWNGKGQAQIYLQSAGGVDWTEISRSRHMLAFSLKVMSRPTQPTTLRMDCIYPCGAKADVTRLLNAVPLNTWARVTVDLRCFLKFGLIASKVETPFLLTTAGKLDLAVSYIDLEPIGASHPTITCD